MRSALVLALLVTLGASSFGCATDAAWRGAQTPSAALVAAVYAEDEPGHYEPDRPEDVPLVPPRRRLRPCCAFGSGLRVRVGALALPVFAIGNIKSPDDIGHHTYDSGVLSGANSPGREHNGLVYTCRGGFIDTAHVRDYADWTLYLSTRFGRELETGSVIDLGGEEGGVRRVRLAPVSPELVRAHGRRDMAIAMAQWAAYQISLWHEIATWYGWSSFGAFPERVSAFSPEDVYSNVVGLKLAGPVIWQGGFFSEDSYNASIDEWLEQTLRFLGALDRKHGVEAIEAIDQLWWDSGARLPDANLVKRRSIQGGPVVWPARIPTSRMGPKLKRAIDERCGTDVEPRAMRVASRVAGLRFDEVLRFEVDVDASIAVYEPFDQLGETITQKDFPLILETIREQNVAEFGEGANLGREANR